MHSMIEMLQISKSDHSLLKRPFLQLLLAHNFTPMLLSLHLYLFLQVLTNKPLLVRRLQFLHSLLHRHIHSLIHKVVCRCLVIFEPVIGCHSVEDLQRNPMKIIEMQEANFSLNWHKWSYSARMVVLLHFARVIKKPHFVRKLIDLAMELQLE